MQLCDHRAQGLALLNSCHANVRGLWESTSSFLTVLAVSGHIRLTPHGLYADPLANHSPALGWCQTMFLQLTPSREPRDGGKMPWTSSSIQR